MSTPVGLGVRVVRGPDWKWGDQDGGEGCTGTVVEICAQNAGNVAGKSPDKTVIVQWDVGARTNYRVGHQNAFDLRVIDNAPIGIRHLNVNCKTCSNSSKSSQTSGGGIAGIRWNCSLCADVDLCTPCYMAEKHDVTHIFWRIDHANEASGVLQPPRRNSRKVPLRGIYPGAKVKRGHDWAWDDQDGGVGKVGKITEIQGWDDESTRSVASVAWPGSHASNIYRVGHRGKVDLECIPGGVATNGHYYPDHLPVLGRPSTVSVSIQASQPVQKPIPVQSQEASTWSVGDRVEVNVTFEALRQLQECHGGFNPRMAEIIGKPGTVHRITNNGDVRVQYPGTPEQNFRWTLNPKALAKSNAFKSDDVVRIIDDVAALVRLQADHGDWSPAMREVAGKTGRVVKVYDDGDVRVKIIGNTWTFNPACLRIVQGSATQMNNTNVNDGNDAGRYPAMNQAVDVNQLSNDVSKIQIEQIVTEALQGNVDAIQKRLTSSTSWKKSTRNLKAVRVALQAAARKGHLKVVRLLVEHCPDQIDMKSDGKTALHVASSAGQMAIVSFLLDASNGSNIDIRDDDGDSALHFAAFGKKLGTIDLLISRGADVNAVNAKRCSVLHVSTVMKDGDAVALLLRHPDIDVNIKDNYGDTPLHEAIVKEDAAVLNLLCTFPKTDFTIMNRRGFNCLHYAALKGNLVAIQLIISRVRHLVEVKKEDGFSALLLSSLNGHPDCVKLLLDEGKAVPDQTDNRGQTALHSAVHQGHAAVVETILSRFDAATVKKLINKEDFDGETSLHIALSREGDPPLPLSSTTAPATFAIAEKVEKFGVPRKLVHAISVATYLISKGGKLTVKNRRAHTPLDHVFDPMAKAFLLDTVEQLMSAKQSTQPAAANPANTPPSPTASAAPTAAPGSRSRPTSPRECRICCESLPRVVFEPCGHQIVCTDCSKRMKKCLECKVVINGKIFPPESSVPKSEKLIHALEAKVQDFEDRFLCSICMERNKTIVFLCGHGSCLQCAETLATCHMCRSAITKKIFMY